MISVVIVNFNGMQYLSRCLTSLEAQTLSDIEVIIVDNGSSDGSVAFLKEHFPDISLLEMEFNLGFAEGTNRGISVASGEYIMTLNNDTWIEPDCISRLAAVMGADPEIGMCASRMLFPDGRINSTGICISRSGAAWDRGMYEEDRGQYDRVDEVFGPCAGAALYRRSMLEEIGVFDPDFFLYVEDVDLAFRAQLAGWRCLYVPDAKVYHVHGGTAGVGSDLSVYYGNRNVLWYLLKNMPLRILLTSLPWIIGRHIAVIPYYMIKGKGRTILRSKADALMGISGMLAKRRKIQQTVPDSEIMRFIATWAAIGREDDVGY